MTTLSTLETLKGWAVRDMHALISPLNASGIVTDEDDTGLSSAMVEAWSFDCETLVRSHGYTGGAIQTVGKFFNEHGAIYGLYDSERIDYKAALAHLENVNARPV